MFGLKSIKASGFTPPIGASQKAGFTLVELIVTIMVAGTFVGSTALIISAQAFLSQRGRDVTVTNSFVENKIEALRSIGYLGLTLGTTDLTNELPTELKPPRSGTLTISSNSIATKKVFITITYNDQGQPRTYSYTTLIGELGVGQY